jgi:Ser/Thr protein kinase RdoA (MazF antagonist)
MEPRAGAADLERHLESAYGVEVARISELDLGVFSVDLRDGAGWIARLFPAVRPIEQARGDAALLAFLAEHDFPAERPAAPAPVSVLRDQALLVTERVDGVARAQRRAAIRDAGGLRALGFMLAVLQGLAVVEGPGARDGGAWHHLADGTPADEIAVARQLLEDAKPAASRQRAVHDRLRAALDEVDDGDGLPQSLVHPDFVMANVVATPDRGLVVVDWAGAGRGPRAWPLAFLLWSVGFAGDLSRVDRVVAGYRTGIDPEPEEVSRLAGLVRARPIVFEIFNLAMGRKSLADAARGAGAAHDLADVIATRAREGLTAPPTELSRRRERWRGAWPARGRR